MKHLRKVLKITGGDRQKFLNDLLTVNVRDALIYGALLTPQGKILTDLFAWGEGEAYFLDLPNSQFDAVKMRLGMYKLRADVELEDTDLHVFQAENGMVDPRDGRIGARHYGNAPDGLLEDYTARRISAKVPEFGVDFDTNEAYPIEWRFDQMHGIDYRKGCYVGQEIAARMRHKTTLQKTIHRVAIDGDAQTGAEITADGKPAGKLLSHLNGVGLAFLRVKYAEAALMAGDAKLTVNELA